MGSMARSKDSQPLASDPDLFSFAPKDADETRSPTPAVKTVQSCPRFLLPENIDKALSFLEAADLERLREAIERQCKQRGLTETSGHNNKIADKVPAKPGMAAPTRLAAKPAKAKGEPIALTPSKINAIRAAFKAGVKPTLICRQFGVSQTAVRQALMED